MTTRGFLQDMKEIDSRHPEITEHLLDIQDPIQGLSSHGQTKTINTHYSHSKLL